MSVRPSALPLPKLYTHLVSSGDLLRAGGRARPAGLRREAERVLFNRLRRDVDTTMEPRLDGPDLDDHRPRAADRARAATDSADEVMNAVKSRDSDDDQVYRYNVVQ